MRIQPVSELKALERSVEQNTEKQREAVLAILQTVKKDGDQALLAYTKEFDGVSLETLEVTKEEIVEACSSLDEGMLGIIREAAANIREYHEKQKRQSWFFTREDGTLLGQKVTPLERVGVYVPGGTAAYPSSVLMGVIPAAVAGVEEIVLASPPGKDGKIPEAVLAAAHIAGVKRMFKMGGAQAIGALAYGTETVPKTDKIVGPGNIYVALAKREVFGVCDIDMIAGPSEIAVLADATANPHYIAADLLSQAEHDPRSAAVLVTTSNELAEQVVSAVNEQLETLPRKEIASKAISKYGIIYVVKTIEEGAEVINRLAPEHLEIMTEDPLSMLGKIKHAGAIFLGENSSEPVGDYFAGSNHVLPTSGTARFSSPLNVDDFTKKSSVIRYSGQALKENGRKISAFARLEGLEAHARAIDIRLEEL